MDAGRRATAFLTGATGFIGGRLATALDARGYRLRCLVRRPERAAALARLGAELIVGDVTDAAAMRRGMQDARYAFHLAADYRLGVRDATDMQRVNVAGTRTFIEALRGSAVSRGVHVSTTQALGPAGAGDPAHEDAYDGPYPSAYTRTKADAHRVARDAQRAGVPLVIVCPALVYGPGDPGQSGWYIKDVLRHRLPGQSTRVAWFSYVHVDDVVDGIIAAAERGRIGATYVLSGEALPVHEFTRRIAELGGTWVSPLRFPPLLVRWTGILMDAFSRVTGVRMPITRELAEVGGTGSRWVHPHDRATADLGYAPRSLAQGLPETVRDAQQRIAAGR